MDSSKKECLFTNRQPRILCHNRIKINIMETIYTTKQIMIRSAKIYYYLSRITVVLCLFLGGTVIVQAQTATIISTKATQVYKGQTSRNFGSCQGIGPDNASNYQQNPLLEFDLSTIPAGATITSATLRMVHAPNGTGWDNESGSAFTSIIRRVTTSWVEGSVCNTTQSGSATWSSSGSGSWTGGSYAGTNYGTLTAGASDATGTVYNITITTLVQEWYNGTSPNHGLGIVPSSLVGDKEESWYYMYSDDATDPNNRPQLIVNYSLPPVGGTASKTDACIGVANGSITVSNPTGGSGTYQYQINSGAWQSSNVFNGLTAGTYTVQIRDANNITNQTTLSSQSIGNLPDSDGDNISNDCDLDDDNDGILDTVEGSGNIDGDGLINSLDNDSDGDGCFDAIEGGAALTSVDANGRLTGGVGSNGVPTAAGGGQTLGGSQVATRVVIVTNPSNQSVTPAASATFSISARGDNATSYSGGTPSYGTAGNSNVGLLYQWYLGDPDAGGTALTNTGVYSGVTTLTLNISNSTGLYGNTYFVLVRHSSNDCIQLKRSAALTLNCGAITASVTSQTNVNCFGTSTGAVTVAAANGVAPYTYKLGSGAFGSSGTFSNLAAGAYIITAKDAGGCEETVSVTITQPSAALTVSQSTVQPQCFAAGSITPTVIGGTAPYTYDWADIPGINNTTNRMGLAAGTYNLTVTDSKGCTVASGNIVLNAPSNCDPIDICRSSVAEVFSVTPDPANISYTWTVPAGAIITAGQGTPQITVNWTGVTPGTYQVCVVAVNNCNESAQTCIDVDVIQPMAQASVVLPICKDRTIGLLATGGVSYAWTGPNSFTSSSANPTILNANAALHNGTYTVVVTDASGCQATATVNVTVEDNPVLTTASVTNATCNQSNGAINITVSGGTPAYDYDWNNGASTEDLTNLSSGSYTLTVTDSKGCFQTATVAVISTDGPTVTRTTTNVTCNGASTGTINVTVTGGTAPYTYLWSDGATTEDRTGLVAGTYSVTVKDATGCVSTTSATLTQPAGIVLDHVKTDVNCFGGLTGSINLSVSGGTAPYTYAWTRNSIAFSGNIQDQPSIGAGTYQVTVTDANGCTATQTIVITQPSAALSATRVISNVSCRNGTNGQIVLNVTGGTAPYTYAWTGSNSFTATTKDIINRPAGTYNVTITDANGCTFPLVNMQITQPASLISVTPVNTTNVLCFGDGNGSIDISASGGTPPYTYGWNTGATTQDISGLNPGDYNVVVTDANGCSVTSNIFTISGPTAPISATITPTDADCFGASTGEISITNGGGTPPYTYLWSNGSTSQNLFNLPAGDYSVTVTDANACKEVFQTSVGQPTQIIITGAITNALCSGSATGAITVSVTGGSAPYTYKWLDGPTSQNRTNLIAGNYTLEVTDNTGCKVSKTFTVNNTSSLSIASITTPISCFGNNNGRVNLIVTGGVAPVTFSWSNGATTEDISGLSAGTYSVTVSDNIGCVKTLTASPVTSPTVLTASAAQTKSVSCKGGSDGEATVTGSGGTAPYTYNWSNGAMTATATGLQAGTYNVFVTDANGCTATASVVITEPTTEIELFVNVTNNSSCSVNKGAIDLIIQNGVAPFTYVWTGPTAIGNVQDPFNLLSGAYTVTVTDALGCSRSISATVGSAPALSVSVTVENQSCQAIDGKAFSVVTGGVGPFTYSWSSGGITTKDLTGLPAGTYTVTVTDANNCTATASGTLIAPNCQPPVAVDDPYTTPFNTPFNGTVASNDSDPDNALSELLFDPLDSPLLSQGTLVWDITGNGSFTFTPALNFVGVITIPYRVCDPTGLCDDANLIITVSARPPIATDDINNTPINTPVTGNVLTNDDDPQGLPLTVNTSIPTICPPKHGTVVMQANGNYTYTPTNNFVGTDNFCYIVCSSIGLCDTATVTIDIIPLVTKNSVVANDDATQTQVGVPVKVRVLANDFDPQGDKFASVTRITNPTNGTVVYNPSDSSFTYTPTGLFVGKNNFKYVLCDVRGACDTATVTVDVLPTIPGNDPPVAVDDANVTRVNVPVSGTVATNDSDPNNDPLVFTKLTNPVNGTVVFNPNGTYTYTPNNNYAGPDRFIYKVCDNGTPNLCDTATVYITVLVSPPIATDDINNTPINTPVTGNVLTNDDDPQGLPLTVNTSIPTICPPKHGTVVMQANGNYTYTPTNNFVGTDNFCYVVCNSAGLCDTATVTIDILPLVTKNSVVANDDATQTQVGVPVKVRVLANDFDPQGDKFASVTRITNPTNGTVVYNPADSSFTYTPTGLFVGKDRFKYVLCDVRGACDTATVTIDVLPLITGNDPPIAVDDANVTRVNVPVSGTVATNDSDPNNDPLVFTKLTNPANGTVVFNPNGTYTYTPNNNYAGPDRFIYKVCDNGTPNLCDTATVYITVLVSPPIATDDINNTPINTPVTGNVLTNDDDPQGLPLTVNTSIPTICPPKHGTVVMQANGNYTYTPTNNFVGTDNFCYVVCNSAGLCDTATVTIDILPLVTINSVVANDDASQTQVGVPVKVRVLANDFDPQGDQFASVTRITNPTNGTVVYNPADSSFTYTPTGLFVGKDRFKYVLCDVKGACDTATVTIDVLPLITGNDPPVAVDDANVTQVNVPVSGTVATNDSDPNNDPLVFTKLTNPANGTVVFNPNGTYTYTPNPNYVGPDRFIYKVCDNGTPNLCDTATVYITILQVTKVALLPKVYLQGSLFGVFSGNLMRDDLRVKNLIPRKSPYLAWNPITPADTITSNTVLTVTGQNAIVDWVFVELRSATDSTKVIDSRSALVQRDGDIVDVDGTSAIVFTSAIPANYFVVVKHRNHLGVMTKNALPLTHISTVVDFRLVATPTYVLANSPIHQSQVNVVQGKALWAGNALYDGQVIYQGTSNDVNVVYQQVIGAAANVIGLPFFILAGYHTGDINMDGEVIFQGTTNDIEYIYQNVVNNHGGNSLKQSFFIIQEQLPK